MKSLKTKNNAIATGLIVAALATMELANVQNVNAEQANTTMNSKRVDMTIDQIASSIRQAHLKGVAALLDALEPYAADLVTIRNFPPRPHVDGVKTGAEWIAFERAASSKGNDQIKNLSVTNQKVVVDGDKIVLSEVLSGVGPNGKQFNIPNKLEFTVVSGRITGYDAYYDANQTPPEFLENEEKIASAKPQHRAVSKTPTPVDIAYEVHEAHLKSIHDLLNVLEKYAADRVTIKYHPPRPFVEGEMSGKEWIGFERSMVEKTGDQAGKVTTLDRRIAVIDNDVILEETILGKGPDGKDFRVPFRGALHVKQGKITGYDAWFDPSTTPAFMENGEKETRKLLEEKRQKK